MTDVNKKKLLIVDDELKIALILQTFCRRLGHESLVVGSGEEALVQVPSYRPDLVLMDVTMPGIGGLEATRRIKADKEASFIPVIILTARGSRGDILEGLSAGADDYLIKPVDLEELALRVKNHLKTKEYHDLLLDQHSQLEKKVADRTKELQDAVVQLDKACSNIQESHIETIYRLTLAAEYKDEDTGRHIHRIPAYAQVIGEVMGLDKEFITAMFYAAPMHDIGKVGIPESILLKKGPLTPQEWDIMTRHTLIGARILTGSSSPFLKMAEEIALCHHENWDGTGYPRGLKGEDIPLAARIIKIVDIYDALRSRRPYKDPVDHAMACRIIERGDGRVKPCHLDSRVLAAFLESREKFCDVFESAGDAVL